jgi:hypothetical protein
LQNPGLPGFWRQVFVEHPMKTKTVENLKMASGDRWRNRDFAVECKKRMISKAGNFVGSSGGLLDQQNSGRSGAVGAYADPAGRVGALRRIGSTADVPYD